MSSQLIAAALTDLLGISVRATTTKTMRHTICKWEQATHTHTERNTTLYQNLINAPAIKHASFTVAAAAVEGAVAVAVASPSAEAATSTHAASTDLSTLSGVTSCGTQKRRPATWSLQLLDIVQCHHLSVLSLISKTSNAQLDIYVYICIYFIQFVLTSMSHNLFYYIWCRERPVSLLFSSLWAATKDRLFSFRYADGYFVNFTDLCGCNGKYLI